LFSASAQPNVPDPHTIVLAAVLEYGEFPEILRTADVIRERLKRDVAIFFAKPHYRRLAEDTAELVAHGHRWIDANGTTHAVSAEASPSDAKSQRFVPAQAEPVLTRRPKLPRPVATVAVALGLALVAVVAPMACALRGLREICIEVVNLWSDLRRFQTRARQIEDVVKGTCPCLIIVSQAPVGTELSFLLRAARKHGVPTIFAPFAMFGLRELAEFAHATPAHHLDGRPLNRVLAAVYPRWAARFDGKWLLRLPGPRGLALELAGLVGANPWFPCAEPVTAIACDSRLARRGFEQLGMVAGRIESVGAPVHDCLAEHMARGVAGRDALMRRFGLDSTRPLLTCGWPVNMFDWAKGRGAVYTDYASLARAWASALAKMRDTHGLEVLVSVHPKTLDEEIREATNRGLTVVRGDSDGLVAHCDLFTTLNGSSLTAWAIACNKPVVLFDCFRTGYTEFDDVPGCIMVGDLAAFVAELDRLCGDARARAVLADAQRPVAGDWGLLDGHAQERLAALAAELMTVFASEPSFAPASPSRSSAATAAK
jgi:hypothetical protein